MWYRRNPITWITEAYYTLLPIVPTYRDALNICLVLGGLRQATSITPDRDPVTDELRYPDYDVIHREIIKICKGEKQIRITAFQDALGNKCPLIFIPEIGELVDSWGGDLNDYRGYGEVLGYYCAGANALKDKFFFSIISVGPETGRITPFFAQVCPEVSEKTVAYFKQCGQEIKDFFLNHEITDKIGLDIRDKKMNLIHEEWF